MLPVGGEITCINRALLAWMFDTDLLYRCLHAFRLVQHAIKSLPYHSKTENTEGDVIAVHADWSCFVFESFESFSNAALKSLIKSSACSMPTDKRISELVIPAFSRASCVIDLCDIETGWLIELFTPPTLSVRLKMLWFETK